jgi:hypothetical protein
MSEAQTHIERALAFGTQDVRLWLHAGVIASANGRAAEASQWWRRAEERQACLLPTERAFLHARVKFGQARTPIAPSPARPESFSAGAASGPVVNHQTNQN